MGKNDSMTQVQFAEFYGVSQPMVSRYISQGKIPAACITTDGRFKKIIVDCAVRALNQNLDPTKRQTPELDSDLEFIEVYEDFIKFDPEDPEERSAAVTISLDILSFLAANLENGSGRLQRHIEDIADQFDLELVNVEGLTGRRCVPIEN